MSDNQKHTPGPWRWLKSEELNLADSNCHMARLVGPLYDTTVNDEWHRQNLVCHFGNDESYYPEEGTEPSDADKALIAAAPDLLEALEELLNTPFDSDIKTRLAVINKANAAIAKAKGGAA